MTLVLLRWMIILISFSARRERASLFTADFNDRRLLVHIKQAFLLSSNSVSRGNVNLDDLTAWYHTLTPETISMVVDICIVLARSRSRASSSQDVTDVKRWRRHIPMRAGKQRGGKKAVPKVGGYDPSGFEPPDTLRK